MTGPRGATNRRLGAWHGRAKWPEATVKRARELHGAGHGYKAIGALTGVPWRTVADWVRFDTRWAG